MTRVRGAEGARRRNRRHAVPRNDGQQHKPGGPRREQKSNSGQRRIVVAEHAAQERTPREVHGQVVCQAAQRLGWMLSCRHDEQRVANVAANRSAGRARHRGRIGIHADHERVGLPHSSGEDRVAVARAKVYCDGGVVSCQASDIAGVKLVNPATSNDTQHSRKCIHHSIVGLIGRVTEGRRRRR